MQRPPLSNRGKQPIITIKGGGGVNPCHCHKVPPPPFYIDPREVKRPEKQTSWDFEKYEETVAGVSELFEWSCARICTVDSS
jgi:hypothetical protein